MSATNLGIKVDGKNIFATPSGLKLTARGRVIPVGDLLGTMSKGEARSIRKALHRAGKRWQAAAKRNNEAK